MLLGTPSLWFFLGFFLVGATVVELLSLSWKLGPVWINRCTFIKTYSYKIGSKFIEYTCFFSLGCSDGSPLSIASTFYFLSITKIGMTEIGRHKWVKNDIKEISKFTKILEFQILRWGIRLEHVWHKTTLMASIIFHVIPCQNNAMPMFFQFFG